MARRRSGVKREILDAARELLVAAGTGGVTLEAVAARLELSKPAIYHYFSSKAALLYAVTLDEHTALAHRLREATSAARDGLAAIEAVIRATVLHYAGRIDVFRVVTQAVQAEAALRTLGSDGLAPFHSLNDLSFGPAAAKLAEDIRAGRLPRHANPRRLVFSAYLAAFGLLSMKAMVERVNDPLGFSDEALVDELCATFRAAAKVRSLKA